MSDSLKDSLKSVSEEVERLNQAITTRETDLESSNASIQQLQMETEKLLGETEQLKSQHLKEVEEKINLFEEERGELAKSNRTLEDDLQKLRKLHENEVLQHSEALKEAEHDKGSWYWKDARYLTLPIYLTRGVYFSFWPVFRIRFILIWVRIRILLQIRPKIGKLSTFVLLFFYKKNISLKYDLFCYLLGNYLCQ